MSWSEINLRLGGRNRFWACAGKIAGDAESLESSYSRSEQLVDPEFLSARTTRIVIVVLPVCMVILNTTFRHCSETERDVEYRP